MRSSLFLFVSLNDADARWIAEAGVPRTLAPEEILIRRGSRPNGLYLILDGTARVVGQDGETIALRRPGESVGEVSFVDTQPASATVMATEPLRSLWLAPEAVACRAEADPGFAGRFYRGLAILLANRLREATLRDRPEAMALDDLVLDSMTRAGDRFRLLAGCVAVREQR